MFSKRHYILIAKLIKDSENLEQFTEKIIKVFSARGEFSETRFREAIKK